MAFEVKGEIAQWRVVYERLATMGIGDIITDDELLALLPGTPEGSVRGAFFRAKREMQDEHHRSLDRVRNKGYRVVEAREHADLAKRQHKRANRRMAAAIREARSADRSLLGREDRLRIDAIEDHLRNQAGMIKRLESRQEKAEQRIAVAEKDAMRLSDDVEQMRAEMQRHRELLKRHGLIEDDGDGQEAVAA